MQERELTSYALFAPLSKQERETVGRYLDKIDVPAGKRAGQRGRRSRTSSSSSTPARPS